MRILKSEWVKNMPSVTLTLSDDTKTEIQRLSWINWSELIRIELSKKLKRDCALDKISKLTKKNKLTKKDILKLAEELKSSVWKAYKEE